MHKHPIRVGIVGAGKNTRERHIPGLQAIDGVEIVSVCNRTSSSGRTVAETFKIKRVEPDWNTLVSARDIDAVVIGTWPYMHCPVTLAALKAGKHVMCEARMALDLEQAREMYAASKQNPQLVAQIVPAPFTLGVDRTIRRIVDSGELGALLAIDLRVSGESFLDQDSPMTWRQNREYSGFNILTMGIWYEALMRWVGEAECLVARGRVFQKKRVHPETGAASQIHVPEHLDIIADMACGAQAHMSFSSVTGLVGQNTATLFGSAGTLRLQNGVLSMGRRGERALTPLDVPASEAGAWRVEEEFVNAIRGVEKITHTTFEDGVRYMSFTQAVADSLASGRLEKVAPTA